MWWTAVCPVLISLCPWLEDESWHRLFYIAQKDSNYRFDKPYIINENSLTPVAWEGSLYWHFHDHHRYNTNKVLYIWLYTNTGICLTFFPYQTSPLACQNQDQLEMCTFYQHLCCHGYKLMNNTDINLLPHHLWKVFLHKQSSSLSHIPAAYHLREHNWFLHLQVALTVQTICFFANP